LRLFVVGRSPWDPQDDCRQVTTDKGGRFRAEGLVPGEEYSVLQFLNGRILATTRVEAGKHHDGVDIRVHLDK
jgi:hypothetical protein